MTPLDTKTHLLIVLGSGGVGKTTTAASLGCALAARGLKCVVLTVDPAKRLAQALGLESLSDEAQKVKSYPNGGELSALWLDSRQAFEKLVRKFTPSEQIQNLILNHRLFKILQSQLGGIEEYLGVERVLSLSQSGLYDVCILDTPPSRHALDFIDSPKHLLKFFDDSILKHFLNEKPTSNNSFFQRILKSGKNQALDVFKNVLGHSFLSELSALLTAIQPVRDALKKHAGQIEEWIRTPQCHSLFVSTLEAYPLQELRILSLELASRQLAPPEMLVLNKAMPSLLPSEEALREALGDSAGTNLYARAQMQLQLRHEMSKASWWPKKLVEVPRYSLRLLGEAELLEIGQKILNVWDLKIVTDTTSSLKP